MAHPTLPKKQISPRATPAPVKGRTGARSQKPPLEVLRNTPAFFQWRKYELLPSGMQPATVQSCPQGRISPRPDHTRRCTSGP